MKKARNLLLIIWLFTGIILIHGCKKDPVIATLTTTAVSNITITTATSGGNITSDGGAEVTARGVCWGTATSPTVSGSHTSDGDGTGSFTSSLTGLSPNTPYFVRAYATNSAGTAYGNEVSFTTNPIVGATLTTTTVGTITATSAVSGGNITADGGGAITARGVCWHTAVNPTIANNKTTDGAGTGTFTSNLTNLQPGTTYYVKAYATNSSGTTYGNEVNFKTLAVVPTITTATVTGVTVSSATSGGNITADGGAPVSDRGVCWSTAQNPTVAGTHTTDGSGIGIFTSSITGLTQNTLYYVRAYATNSAGVAYGNQVSFTTSQVVLATLTTTAVSSITSTTAVSGGNITAAGGGTISARGVCWGITANPTISGSHSSDGTGTGNFASNLTGLTTGTIYYVRAYATNEAGTAYGNQLSFITPVTDIEGNVYKTVLIGTQVWMAENLKTTKYKNDTDIPNVTDNAAWVVLTTSAYCWYNNDVTNKPLYGALYNWHTVNTGNLCPAGWHVPTDTEYKTLEMFLGMTQGQADAESDRGTDEGTKMKNTTGWDSDGNGTNTSGFSALPGGFRYRLDGSFLNMGALSYWWSSTEFSATNATYRRLDYDRSTVYRQSAYKTAGKYVRCVKD